MIKNYLLAIGVVFLLVGLWGYLQNPVMGVFAVDGLHNLIHLGTGIMAIAFGLSSESSARSFSKVIGYIYLLVAILGIITPGGTVLGLFVANMADHILHFIFAAAFLALGYAPLGYPRPAASH